MDTGAHRSKSLAFPDWVPTKVLKDAEKLAEAEAEALLASYATSDAPKKTVKKRPRKVSRTHA